MALVTTLPNEECKLTYGDQIKETMVCVDGQYNQGACHVKLISLVKSIFLLF